MLKNIAVSTDLACRSYKIHQYKYSILWSNVADTDAQTSYNWFLHKDKMTQPDNNHWEINNHWEVHPQRYIYILLRCVESVTDGQLPDSWGSFMLVPVQESRLHWELQHFVSKASEDHWCSIQLGERIRTYLNRHMPVETLQTHFIHVLQHLSCEPEGHRVQLKLLSNIDCHNDLLFIFPPNQ